MNLGNLYRGPHLKYHAWVSGIDLTGSVGAGCQSSYHIISNNANKEITNGAVFIVSRCDVNSIITTVWMQNGVFFVRDIFWQNNPQDILGRVSWCRCIPLFNTASSILSMCITVFQALAGYESMYWFIGFTILSKRLRTNQHQHNWVWANCFRHYLGVLRGDCYLQNHRWDLALQV